MICIGCQSEMNCNNTGTFFCLTENCKVSIYKEYSPILYRWIFNFKSIPNIWIHTGKIDGKSSTSIWSGDSYSLKEENFIMKLDRELLDLTEDKLKLYMVFS